MAISNVTVYQDNIVSGVNIMAVHSPLVFLIDVTYSGAVPTLYCDITIDGITPVSDDATFKCVFHSDQTPTVRRFMFRADSLLRGYMEDFEDFVQTAESVSVVLKTQQAFTLVFRDDPVTFSDTVELVAFAAKRQYGQTPAISEIYNNEDVLYICGVNMPVYVYFYNSAPGEVITITDGTTTYDLATGGEDVVLSDTMAVWDGTGNETSPDNWVISSTKARTATWRIYESSAGVGLWKMYGNVLGDYFALRNDTITWTKGEEVWLRVRYRGGGANVYIGAIEKALYGSVVAGGATLALPASVPFVEVETRFISFSSDWVIPGPRCPAIFLLGTASIDIDVYIDTITIFKPASSQQYYRLKVTDLTVDTTYRLMNGATELAAKVVRVKPFCTDYRYLRYLDRNGQYRFYPFNDRWQMKDAPKAIGKINQLITDIYTNQGESKNIGYTNERKLTLVADDVLNDELDILADVYTSPRVYLHTGVGDAAENWLLVTVTGDGLVRRKKGNTSKVELTITLPEWYNITML